MVINVLFDKARLRKVISGVVFGAVEGNPLQRARLMSHFILDDKGAYMDEKAGFALLIENLTLEDIDAQFAKFWESLSNAAVNPTTGGS